MLNVLEKALVPPTFKTQLTAARGPFLRYLSIPSADHLDISLLIKTIKTIKTITIEDEECSRQEGQEVKRSGRNQIKNHSQLQWLFHPQ